VQCTNAKNRPRKTTIHITCMENINHVIFIDITTTTLSSSTIKSICLVSVLIVTEGYYFWSRQKFCQYQHFEYFVHSQLVVWINFQKTMPSHAFSRVDILVAASSAANKSMFVILLSLNCTTCLFQKYGYRFRMSDRDGRYAPPQLCYATAKCCV